MRVEIRAATLADLDAVDALLQRSYPRLLKADYPPSILVTALPRMTKAQPALLTSGTYYVAEADARLLGAGGWTPGIPGRGQATEPGRANVRHVVTDPDALRRGIGRALLETIFWEAKAAGMRWMHCMSTRTAEPFYASMGFLRRGEITVPLGPGIDFPAIEMRRDL